MELEAVGALEYFSRFEKRVDEDLIDWSVADETLFSHLDDIRRELGYPINIIREDHPDRSWAAVDWTSTAPMDLVIQVVGPRPLGFGVYAGTHGPAYHVDLQVPATPFRRYPRWMAVRPSDRERLGAFTKLITHGTARWVYLRWNHPDSFSALLHIMHLASENQNLTH